MKTLLAGIVAVTGLVVSMPATAQYHHGHGYRVQPIQRVVPNHYGHRPQRHWHPNHGWIWVVPTIIGGALVYDIVRHHNQPGPIVTEEVISPAPTRTVECTEWREIQSNDGKIYRERTCKDINQ